MDKNIVVRNAGAKDLNALIALDKKVWGEYNASDGNHVWRLWIDYGIVYVALKNEELIGFLVAFPTTHTGNLFILHKIFVDEKYRRSNIGSEMIKQLISWIRILVNPGTTKDKKSFSIVLTVDPKNNAAIDFYEKLGFDDLFLEKSYYGDGVDRKIFMKMF